MPSTHKKVIVCKIDRDTLNGYVASSHFVVAGKLEVLNTAGNVVAIDLKEVKALYFVREFGDLGVPLRKTFPNRPRTEGLWVRLRFRDNDIMEGMMTNDLSQVDPDGFLINPPDLRANVQRMFVPRSALSSLTVIAVIGTGKAHRRKAPPADARQVQLFEQ